MAADFDPAALASGARPQLRLETLEWEELTQRKPAWSRLAASAIEPNAFLEPCFAVPAAQHLAPMRAPVFLVASAVSADGESSEMAGLWPLVIPRRGFTTSFARTWLHGYATSGCPLLEPKRGAETLDLMLKWLEVTHPHIAGVEFPALDEAGPVAALIRHRAKASDRDLASLDPRSRAILKRSNPPETGEPGLDPRPKTLRRQWRKLSALGVQYVSKRDPGAVRAGVETFLALEASGWKGRRGTALLMEPGAVTFARTMTRLLAQEGRCRIESLELDGAPLAMLIVLQSGDRAFAWKMAYDEAWSDYSPGNQLIAEFTKRQLSEPSVRLTDSCAAPDDPLINRFWSDKVTLADLLLANCPGKSSAFQSGLARETLRRRLRSRAKDVYAVAMAKRASTSG